MKMMDHPNIIKLYESFEDIRQNCRPAFFFFYMERRHHCGLLTRAPPGLCGKTHTDLTQSATLAIHQTLIKQPQRNILGLPFLLNQQPPRSQTTLFKFQGLQITPKSPGIPWILLIFLRPLNSAVSLHRLPLAEISTSSWSFVTGESYSIGSSSQDISQRPGGFVR